MRARRLAVERHRSQFVISLGEGEKGEALRALFDQAAEQAGELPTVWARRTLIEAAGGRTELSLIRRIERLEERLAVISPAERSNDGC